MIFEADARALDYHPVLTAASIAFGFVYIHPFEDGNGVTTHGVRCLAERRQAPIVPSTVLNVLAPEVMRPVATTVRTAASPLADHMAR